jgi:predicted PhzF superfamily epimerase YddE/YHI9
MRVYVVDTFTQNMFRGNPTGVVLVDQPVDPDWMQAVAAELNQPATTFVDTSSPVGGQSVSPSLSCLPNKPHNVVACCEFG